MKAILKPFFALCGLVALSTALSADSRLFPVGGGGAGWGEPGFLYSDYLQTAAASGREVEFQGSFVLDNRRPFLAELGTAFPGRVVDEVKSLPLREWGLGYVFEKRRPAHQRALLERGWRLADWLAEETLMAATESSRGGGLIRTLEFDLQSELGGRRAQVGLNVLGALRESNDEAIAWQFRGFKSSGGLGGNTGLIWRRAVANDRALAGANVFLDYETYADENFWRGSAGAELRSAWADVFGNVYRGFSDDVKKNNRTTYTADGYDVELNVHSPELPWLVGEVAYYNFEGKAGDKDDDGVRFGLRFNPLTDLELGVEYDNGDSDDDGKKKWAARIRYSGEFGGVLKAQYRPSTNSGNFEPRDWFFAPVEREYSQRIRKSPDSGSIAPEFTFVVDSLPIDLEGEGGQLSLNIANVGTSLLPTVVLMGTISGVEIANRTLTLNANNLYSFAVVQALAGTVTVRHKGVAALTVTFKRTNTPVRIGSTVEISSEEFDYFALLDGNADILLGSGGGMLVAEQRLTTTGDFRRFTVSATAPPNTTLTLGLVVDKSGSDAKAQLPFPEMFPDGLMLASAVIGGVTMEARVLNNLRANVQLAADPLFRTGTTPPIYYKAKTANGPFVVATLEATGGSESDYTWAEAGSGQLEITSGSVVVITSNTPVTEDGVSLSLRAVLNDNASDDVGGVTPPVTVDFAVLYQEIADLSASFDSGVQNVYGLTGEGQEIVVATITSKGGPDAFTYAKTGGQLNVRPADNEGRMGLVVIPASVLPSTGQGAELVLEAELSQPIPGGSSTRTIAFTLTVRYIGVSRISPPAFVAATDKAIDVQSPTSYRVTALTNDRTAMEIATLNEATDGVGGYSYAKVGNDGLNFNNGTREVSIPGNAPPIGQRLGLTVRITDSGSGEEATPDVTVMLTVQYVSVNEIILEFDDRAPTNPNDGLVTVYALQGNADGQTNIARVVLGGGFGGVTVVKTGGQLELSGETSGAQINIPADAAITPQSGAGRELLLMVSANEPPANDPRGITDAKTATMTVQYVQVNQLGGAYYPVDSNGDGEVPSGASRITAPVHTVGMAAAVNTQFTVASLSVSGGVGDYQYRKVGGGSQLLLNPSEPSEILMAGGIVPSAPDSGASPFEIVVAVNDRGTNDNLTPEITLTLTVSYNTIVPIAADVVDTRNNDAVIKPDGGTVYFLTAGNNVATPFGRLNIRGGFGGSYQVEMSNASGITYTENGRVLSMTKCSSGTQSIRFTINDVGPSSDLTPNPFILNFSVTNECVDAITPQLRNADDSENLDASSAVNIYALEGKTEATVVAVWTATGGAGDLTWTRSKGNLNFTPSNRQVQVPQGTSPDAAPNGNQLSVVAVVNDENDKGGFLTEPATVLVTVNYIEVPSVVLNLNRSGNPIDSVVDVYGKEGVAKTEKIADIMTGGGADGANVAATLRTDGTNPTTPNAFAISGNDLNLSRTFPAFSAGAQNVIAVVSANDSGGTQAHTDATPAVEKSATVRLLPVLGTVEAGGNIAVQNLPNIVQPSAASNTQTDITVYVRRVGGVKEDKVIARINPASVENNATVSGVSGLQVIDIDANSGTTGAGLEFDVESGNVAAVKIAATAAATPTGANLNIVMTYNDRGHAIASLTDERKKTLNVHYESVAEFVPQFRNVDDSAIPNGAPAVTVYVAEKSDQPVRVARLSQIGGADGMRVVSRSGDLDVADDGGTFYVSVRANADADTTLVLTVRMDDAPATGATPVQTAQGAVTDPVDLELTVAYLISRDVIANFAPIAAAANDKHFIGALQTDGTRTVFLDASQSRAALPLFQLNAASGSGTYVYTEQGVAGFTFPSTGLNNRMLALQPSVADGAKAYATVKVDDTGGGADQTEPATAAVTVEVKLVRAIDTALLVPADVPGGPVAGTTLGALYVRSAAAAESSSVHIANAVASYGTEVFEYTRQSESSAELLLNADGEVHLAQNYTPDGNKTLSILIAVNDTGDGSTLTEAAMMTLQFVLAETIGAELFLRSNGGAYLPGGSGGDAAWGSETRTVRVKAAEYGNEQVVVGVRGSGGLGDNPPYSIERTGGNENGLEARRVTGGDGYGLAVVVKPGASSPPKTFAITAIVNESSDDPNSLTPGAMIEVTVYYDDVDDIAGAFEEQDGTPIVGRHVVAKQGGADPNNSQVAKITPSGGVGGDSGGAYTFTQDNPGDLIVDGDGKVLVKGGVAPTLDLNLFATVVIDDTGDWAHVSEPLTMEITVLYSSEVPVNAAITDIRTSGTITPNSTPPQTIYFNAAEPHANIPFAQITYTSGLPTANDFDVVASAESGLNYDATNKQLRINAKCNDSPAENKRIRLVVDDKPDPNNVSKPLTVDITVHSGAVECIEPLTARPETINANRGAHITDTPKFYRLAGDELDADLPVATVHVDGGAPDYVSGRSGGGLNVVGNNAKLITVVIPSGMTAKPSPNPLEIVITVNDDSNKGGFLTDVVEVKMTVDFAEVQPHGNLQGELAPGVTGSLEDGLLTVRRVAASSTPLRIVTNIRPAIPTEERIRTEGSFTNFQIVADSSSQQHLQLIAGQEPDGAVRMITVKVENYKPLNRSPDDNLQFAARPDRLFTIAVRYLGELEAAAYDSETETAIAGEVNRYVESDEGAVVVATVSVSGGTTPYTYSIDGGLELHGTDNDNMTVRIPETANPVATPGTKLTARIAIDDTGRADTDSLNVDLTANYILISGHSDLQLVRDGKTDAEDLNGETVYPKIVSVKSSGVVEALSGLAFKAGLSGETLKRESSGSAAALLFADDASVVQIAGDTEPDGSTLALVLRASDGESPAQAKARSDRLYTLQVRYMKELTADARDAASGGDVINAVRQIRVTEAEATEAHFVAHISVDGGAGGNEIAVEGTNFVISGNELQIAAGVNPGELATGLTLIATVKVNDDDSLVGGADTGEVEILVTANYITLPPVEGSFVEGRDGDTAVPTSSPVIVYSAHTPFGTNAPATVAATAKATVGTRTSDTFTFHKIGTGGKLEVHQTSGAVMLQAARPEGPNQGNYEDHVITVEFRAAANAVNSQLTLTVRHQMIQGIFSGQQGMTSHCLDGATQPGGNNRSNNAGTQITVILPTREEGTAHSYPGGCGNYFVNSDNSRTDFSPRPGGISGIARTARDADGLELYPFGARYRVRLSGTRTYTAERQTLSILIVNTAEGAAAHVVAEFLQTVYVVFPGVPKLEAALETPAGAAIDKPLTVYVAAADASAKLVATVKASGGEGDGYSYAGTRADGDSHQTPLEVNTDGEIFIPAGFEPLVSPGTKFEFEVAVDDTGGDATRRGATPQRKVILTVQYIKTSGPLMAEAVYETPNIYEASSTTFYGAKGVKLSSALNVASITPRGGIPNPNYNFEIQEDSSNPAANSELEISGTGNERVVRLKGGASGATPSAETSEARRRVITVRVTDTGDVGNSIQPGTIDVVVSVNFVEVTAHGALKVPDPDSLADLGTDFVVVRPASETEIVKIGDTVDETTTPSNPTFKLTLIAANGLLFNGEDAILEIAATSNPPTGQLLTAELRGSDGEATPQAAARLDKLYTISVRYVPAIAAEVQDSSGARIAAVVELTVLQGVQPAHVVGKIAASGGVTNSYTYAPTAVSGSENLQVDANGDIRIPTGVTPLPGDGRTITVEIAVDDATAADSGETDPANVQITVKYVLLEAPAIEAQNLAGNALDNTNTPTFYRLSGLALTTDMPVAKVAGSKGSGDYTFAIVDEDGAVNANGLKLTGNDGTTLALASGETAAAAGSADRVVTVRLTDTDNRLTSGNTADVIVTVRFEEVAAHADVTFTPQSGINQNTDNEYRVVQAGAPGANVHVLNLVSSDTLSRTEGDAQLVFVAGSPPRLEILDSTPRDGRTLTVVISQTDNDDNEQEIARPDRTYTISVRYIPALAAEARNAAGNAALNAAIVITSKAGLRQVARIAVSGGTSDSYDFTIENLHPAGNDLIVGSSDGIVSIPLEVEPVVGGLALTVRITANDKTDSKDNDATNPASALVTVMYHLLESPEIEAQDKDGTAALTAPTGANGAVFYQLSGTPLAADLPVAKVVGSKGTSPYEFAIEGSNTTGLEVDANTGNIILKSGQSTAATGAAADKVITVRLTDSQDTSETADATLTIRFEAVAPLPVVYLENPNDGFKVYDPTDKTLTVLVNAGVTGKQLVFAEVSGGAPGVNAAFVQGNLEHDAGNLEISIPAGTVPSGQLLSAVMRSTDGDGETTDTPAVRAQKTARPDRDDTILVRYMSHVGLTFTQNDGTTPLDVNTRINLQKIAGTPNLASIFVAKFEGRGGVGEITYSVSGNTESGKNVQYDTTNRVLWIDNNVNPTSGGLEITVVVSADDSGEPATNAASQNIEITYTEISAVPLPGAFAAAAPSANSRIVGAIADDERVTVYGLAADDTSANLLVLDLSHSNNNVAAAQISKQAGSGDLIYSNGQVFIPAANRKDFGTEFKGIFVANDGSPATQNATFEITVLLAQQLDEVVLTEGNAQGKGQYFYTTGSESATDYRPIFGVPAMPDGEFSMSPSGYQYDHNTKRITRNGAPVFVVGNPTTPYNGAPDNPAGGAVEYPNHRVTVFDSAANPKIVPKVFDLNMRHFPLPALAFTSQDGSAPQSTANQIPHTATPTTPIWTFRLGGGLLIRKPYRPFHNLRVSGSGAFVVATLARVDGTPPTTHEFVDMEVRVDATHADFVRDGRTLTLTVTAEDEGYPGLGAVSHVAEVILEQEPIPHVQAVLWTPEAAGTATQISAPVEIAVIAAAARNVASVSVSKGLPAGNAVYTYTSRRIDGSGNPLGGESLLLDINTGIISIPVNLQPGAGEGLTLSLEVVADDTTQPTTNPATVTLVVVYKMIPPLTGVANDLQGTAIDPDNPPIIYQLRDTQVPDTPATGKPVAKVEASGGTAPYEYAVVGSPTDNLGVDASGNVAVAVGQTPDSDILKQRMVTVRITDDSTPEQTADVIVTVIFRAVPPFGDLQIINDRFNAEKNPNGEYVVVREASYRGQAQVFGEFFVSRANDRLSKFAGSPRLRLDFSDGLQSNQLAIIPLTVPGGEPPVPGGLTLIAQIRATDGDGTEQARVRPDREYFVTVVYLAEVDATVEDASNTEIPDLANVDITGPDGVATSVYVADIKGSGGTGEYTYEKATNGGNLSVDDDGQVFISGQTPKSGDGEQLFIVVNVNDDDSGVNDGFTAQKQIRIDVDYILAVGLSGQTQQTDGTAVNGEHIVLRQAGDATPSGGLDAGVKVVGQNGEGTYQYAAAGTAADSQLEVSNTGEVKIKQGQTASGQLLLLTVRITDSASTPATALHTVSIRFNSVAPHADLTADPAAGVTQNDINEYVVVVQGTQSGNVDVLSGIKSGEGVTVSRIGTDPFQLLYVYSPFTGGNLKLAGGSIGEPTGQTLAFQVMATDGDGDAEKAARQDRTFDIAVRYLSHLTGAKLQDASNNDLDLSSPLEERVSSSGRVNVGNIVPSGGTGAYTFARAGADGGLNVDESTGQVFIPATATPTSGTGTQLAITVNVNDKDKDNEVTNGTAIEITVNYIMEATGPALPLLTGQFVAYVDLADRSRNRLCINANCVNDPNTVPVELVSTPTERRLTVFGLASDTTPTFLFNAGFSVPVIITEASGSDFSVAAAVNSPTGTRYPVMLKTENLKRWGTELQARLRVRNTGETNEVFVTVTVLLSERLEGNALATGEPYWGGNSARPFAQFIITNAADTEVVPPAPAYQSFINFPNIALEGLQVDQQGVRATTTIPPIQQVSNVGRLGEFNWDDDTNQLQRRGLPIVGGTQPRFWVPLIDPSDNPKIVPAILSFVMDNRPVPAMSFATTPSGTGSFTVRGGSLKRNYAPYRDMVVEVTGPFVITNKTVTRISRNNHDLTFDLAFDSSATAGSHNYTITVKDAGYPALGEVTHTGSATK